MNISYKFFKEDLFNMRKTATYILVVVLSSNTLKYRENIWNFLTIWKIRYILSDIYIYIEKFS